MALPKLDTPTYELELPSTGEKIKYRPFLVKEQKNLMIASESEDEIEIQNALANLISECTFGKIDPYIVPLFDIEFMFLRIRGKSVGEKVELNVLCPDDNKTRTDITINLEDIDVHMEAAHNNEIPVTDNITIFMRYPTLKDMSNVTTDTTDVATIFELIKKCIAEIHDKKTIHSRIDISEKELEEFIDNLPSAVFENLGEFFNSMPKVQHPVKVKNPKTKKTGEIVIEGIQSFFE